MKSSSFYCHHTFIVHARILLPRAYRRNLKRQEFELKNWVRLVLKERSNSLFITKKYDITIQFAKFIYKKSSVLLGIIKIHLDLC